MNLANKITMGRLFLIPIFLLSYIYLGIQSFLPGLIFIIASLTDFFDGYIARSRNLVTTFGAFLDPLVDKILTLSAFIMLVEEGMIPGFIVVIIVARELVITGFRTIAASNGVVIAASIWGKYKTTFQMLTIIYFLFVKNIFSFTNTWPIPLSLIFLVLTLFFTLISALDYLVKNVQVLDLDNI